MHSTRKRPKKKKREREREREREKGQVITTFMYVGMHLGGRYGCHDKLCETNFEHFLLFFFLRFDLASSLDGGATPRNFLIISSLYAEIW
jgi:hypothetical protein